MQARNLKKTKRENSEEEARKVKEAEFFETASPSFGAAEPEGRPNVKMLRSAMTKCYFTRDALFANFEDDYKIHIQYCSHWINEPSSDGLAVKQSQCTALVELCSRDVLKEDYGQCGKAGAQQYGFRGT